jgi:hypothetical protein
MCFIIVYVHLHICTHPNGCWKFESRTGLLLCREIPDGGAEQPKRINLDSSGLLSNRVGAGLLLSNRNIIKIVNAPD